RDRDGFLRDPGMAPVAEAHLEQREGDAVAAGALQVRPLRGDAVDDPGAQGDHRLRRRPRAAAAGREGDPDGGRRGGAGAGLPGGLEARADQLKELVREGKVDAFETRGREVILYWRAMAPSAIKSLALSAVASVPGEYTGPASRAYLYYTDEHKDWQAGLRVS